MLAVNIATNLQWMAFATESRTWIARCEPLGLTLEGDSLDELHGLIPEVLRGLFEDLIEDDELEQFLLDRGWREEDIPVHDPNVEEISVPWELVAAGSRRDSQRSAH